MSEKAKAPASEMFDQALKNYEQALRAGVKVQEEAAAYWTKLYNQSVSRPALHKQMASLAGEVIPPSQKYMDGCLQILEQSTNATVDLMKKAVEAVQTVNPTECQGKLVDFCESSLKAAKAQTQAAMDLNSKAVDSWLAIARKATAEMVPEKA